MFKVSVTGKGTDDVIEWLYTLYNKKKRNYQSREEKIKYSKKTEIKYV